MQIMEIQYKDIVLLNGELKKRNLRYHVRYKNSGTACIEPPGECCMTEELTKQAYDCIVQYFRSKGLDVIFSDDRYYFSVCKYESGRAESQTEAE